MTTNTVPRLLLRLDAGPVGLGHAVRVAGIVGLIEPRPDLLLVGSGDGLSRWFPNVRKIAPGTVEELAALCDRERPSAVLLDIPHYPDRLFEALRDIGTPIICIDDVGGDVAADLIVNGTILDSYHHYPLAPSDGIQLIGGAFALVRPAFGAHLWQPAAKAAVAIVVGSGERARDWAFRLLSDDLDRTGWGETTMVIGGAFADADRLGEAAKDAGVVLRQSLDATALATLLSSTSVALITGGMIVYEALAVGVPAIVFPQIENLIPEAAFLSSRGMIEDLGFDGGMKLDRVSKAVKSLMNDPERQLDMSQRQRGLIDGMGMKRAAAAISGFLQSRRRDI
jgi:spore coat polysaccharide biosynthesis predicted glycosyltransferase SpsG